MRRRRCRRVALIGVCAALAFGVAWHGAVDQHQLGKDAIACLALAATIALAPLRRQRGAPRAVRVVAARQGP